MGVAMELLLGNIQEVATTATIEPEWSQQTPGMGYRRHYSKKKAKSAFRKGNSGPNIHEKEQNTTEISTVASEGQCVPEQRNYSRLPQEVYDIAKSEEGTCVSILRPKQPKLEEISESPTYIKANRVVNIELLCNFMTEIYTSHTAMSPKCVAPQFKSPACDELKVGLGCSITVTCIKCNFKSERTNLHRTLQTGESSGGRPSVELNVRLANYIETSPVSLTDVRLLFAMLDCPAPAESGIIKNTNKICEAIIKKGSDQLHANRKAVSDILSHTKQDLTTKADTMYNNPNKSRFIALKGTQAITPVVSEGVTKRDLILSMQSHSQICAKKKPGQLLCPTGHEKCTANYPPGGPMSRVEQIAGQSFYSEIEKSVLRGKVKRHVGDGSHSFLSTIRNHGIEKLECIVHVTRNQRYRFYQNQYSETLLGRGNVSHTKKMLCNLITERCATELRRARKRFRRDDKRFYDAVERARINILLCIQGLHINCKQNSFVCKGEGNVSSYMPGQNRVSLTGDDALKLQSVIDYKLKPEMVVKQRYLLSTNSVEALHLRSLRLLPKNKLMKNSFHPRCMNVVLLDSLGLKDAVLSVSREIGFEYGHEALKVLSSLTNKATYYHERQKTQKFKRDRYLRIYKKLHLAKICKLSTQNAANVTSDHSSYTRC